MRKSGKIFDVDNPFTEQTIAETDGGGLPWMLSALNCPTSPAQIHAYGTVIGTGNVIAQWQPEGAQA